MSWDDWKPTKRIGESDRDYRIRLREWENREDNRGRTFSPETGGSGSRTSRSSSSSSSGGNGSCGCIIVIMALILCYGLYVLIKNYTLPTIASLAVTALFAWLTKLWITLCVSANEKLKFFGSEFLKNDLTLFIDRLKSIPEGQSKIKTKRIIRNGIDYIFKPEVLILRIFGDIFYFIFEVIFFFIDACLAGAITGLAGVVAVVLPLSIYIPIIAWLYSTFG